MYYYHTTQSVVCTHSKEGIVDRMQYEIITLIGSAVVTALLQGLAHYIEKPKEPRLLARYAWGTAIILIGFATWRILNNDWLTAGGLLVIDSVAGLAVIGAYAWDGMVEATRKAAMIEETDDELKDA